MRIYILFITLVIIACKDKQENISITFDQSSCNPDYDINSVEARIVRNEIRNDTLWLSLSTVANCCGIYEAQAMLLKDTLNIVYKEGCIDKVTLTSGKVETMISDASCDCCFEFYFTISGVKTNPRYIKINDKLF